MSVFHSFELRFRSPEGSKRSPESWFHSFESSTRSLESSNGSSLESPFPSPESSSRWERSPFRSSGGFVAKLLGRFPLPESLRHDAFHFALEDAACVFNDLENGQAK